MDRKQMLRTITYLCRNRTGFSFSEVLVTTVILTFLVSAIHVVLLSGNSSWQTNSTEVELQQDLRQAMDWMTRDLQQTGSTSLSASVPTNVQPDPITYPDPDDDPAYDWTTYTTFSFQTVTGATSGSVDWNPNANQYNFNGTNFQRSIGTNPAEVIAENIQSLQMRRLYNSSDIVEVALQAQKKTLSGTQGRTITLTLGFHVQMRN